MGSKQEKDKNFVAKLDLFVKMINGDQRFPLKGIPVNMKVRQLKSEVELAAGIPSHLQRLQYLDQGDMNDDHDLKRHDVVYGATVNLKLWNMWEGLIMAASRGDKDEVFRHDITIDVNARFDSVRQRLAQSVWIKERSLMALFVACHRGHYELARKLIEVNADVNGTTPSMRTPLHAAAVKGHDDCVQLLLENGAHLEARDCNGMTALTLAEKYGRKGCVRQLFLHKWKMRASVMNTRIPIESLMSHQKYDSGLITWLRGPEGRIYFADLRNNIPESLVRASLTENRSSRQRSHSTDINSDKYSLYKKVTTRTTMTREKHFQEASMQADLSRKGREAREAREREQREKELREQLEAQQSALNGEDEVSKPQKSSIVSKGPEVKNQVSKSVSQSSTQLKVSDQTVAKSATPASLKLSDSNKLSGSQNQLGIKGSISKVRYIISHFNSDDDGEAQYSESRLSTSTSSQDISDVVDNSQDEQSDFLRRSVSYVRDESHNNALQRLRRSSSAQLARPLNVRLPGEVTNEMEEARKRRLAKFRALRYHMELLKKERERSRPKTFEEWLISKGSSSVDYNKQQTQIYASQLPIDKHHHNDYDRSIKKSDKTVKYRNSNKTENKVQQT